MTATLTRHSGLKMPDTSGTRRNRTKYVYDAYGKPAQIFSDNWSTSVAWGDGKQNEILFCGYRYDPETGLYHVRNRMYHPTLGRWNQQDPLGYEDGMNLYEYVAGGPVNATDPKGEKLCFGATGTGRQVRDMRGYEFFVAVLRKNAPGADLEYDERTNSCCLSKSTGTGKFAQLINAANTAPNVTTIMTLNHPRRSEVTHNGARMHLQMQMTTWPGWWQDTENGPVYREEKAVDVDWLTAMVAHEIIHAYFMHMVQRPKILPGKFAEFYIATLRGPEERLGRQLIRLEGRDENNQLIQEVGEEELRTVGLRVAYILRNPYFAPWSMEGVPDGLTNSRQVRLVTGQKSLEMLELKREFTENGIRSDLHLPSRVAYTTVGPRGLVLMHGRLWNVKAGKWQEPYPQRTRWPFEPGWMKTAGEKTDPVAK